jgi:succinate-semialdehyde dehydrogenase / glutarate-semialdehyde dehydrogenase
VTASLPLFTGLYIDGAWRRGSGELPVLDPTTGDVLAGAATASIDECLTAVDAAAAVQPAWAAEAPRHRAEVLRECFALMIREREAIAQLIQAENGKAHNEAVGEVSYAAEFFRWFSEEAPRIGGELRQAPNGDKQIVVLPEPVGVALMITPWNFPAAMATRKIAPALAAGCACVLKPAPEAPLTSLYLADLIRRAGAPAGVVNVVLPEPPDEPVAAMMAHPAVRKLSFTGSTDVGVRLLAAAAPHVLRASMELGGNAPFIVLDDADLDVAVDAALVAKMRNGGASCIAANRIYVPTVLRDGFVTAFTERMRALAIGFGRERDADVGALVSPAERDKVADLVDSFVDQGGTVVVGGDRLDRAGFFYPPTLVVDVPVDAPALETEIFGPVAPVVTYEDLDGAIAAANATPSGLISYVVGRDTGRALGVGRRLESGMVAVNRGVISDPAAPFGGFKHSGLGKEGGFEGIEEYLRRKYYGVEL